MIIFSKVLSVDESSMVGKISKQWSGLVREMFTDAENFGVTCKENENPMPFDVTLED